MNSGLKAVTLIIGGLATGWMLRGVTDVEKSNQARRNAATAILEPDRPIASNADDGQDWKPTDPTGFSANIDTILALPPGMDRLGLLIRFLAKANGTEMAALAKAIPIDWPISRINDDLHAAPEFLQWRLIFACWFELDPQAAHAFFREADDSILKRLAIESWAATDSEAAMTAISDDSTFRPGIGRTSPVRPLNIGYAVWRNDPDRFWEMVMASGTQTLLGGAAIVVPEQAILALVADDPVLAAERAARFRPDSLGKVLNDWATSNSEKMMRWAFEEASGLAVVPLFPGTDRRILAIQALAESDPNQAAAWLGQYAEVGAAELPLSATLASTWARQDVTAAVAWADSLIDTQQRKNALVAIASATSSRDPYGAAKLLSSINWDLIETPGFGSGTQTIWSGDRYVTSIGHPLIADGQSVAAAVLRELASHDPEAAMAYVAEISDRGMQSEAGDSVWEAVIQGDTNIATAMAVAAATDHGENDPLQKLIRKTAADNPETAFHLAQEIAADLPMASATVALNTAAGAVADSALAVAMISELDPQTQSLISPWVYGHIVSDWSRADLTGATAWVSTLQPGIKRDFALSSLVSEVRTLHSQTDFSSVLKLAEMIENPERRQKVAMELFDQWQIEEPESLVDAVTDEILPNDFSEVLRQRVSIPGEPN